MTYKKATIFVITMAIILLVLGSSYSYFATSISGTSTSSSIVTSALGSVGYITTTPSSGGILPGWEGTGTTSVYLTSTSDKPIEYSCTVVTDSSSTNLYVQTISNNGDEEVPVRQRLSNGGVVVAKGTLAAETVTGASGTAHNVTYKIIYDETGSSQNDEMGQTITFITFCQLDENIYSSSTISKVYWNNASTNTGYDYYRNDQLPETYYTSITDPNLNPLVFVETTLTNNKPTSNRIALNVGGSYIHADYNYWVSGDLSGNTTINRIKSDIETVAGIVLDSSNSYSEVLDDPRYGKCIYYQVESNETYFQGLLWGQVCSGVGGTDGPMAGLGYTTTDPNTNIKTITYCSNTPEFTSCVTTQS